MTAGTCRSCGAPITWKTYDRTGKQIPLDREPRADGNLVVEGKTCRQADQLLDREKTRFVTHFATCPDAEDWRTKQGRTT